MKFFVPLALLVAAVAAQDPKCDAAPIVETCLTSENNKVKACKADDWDCLCAAYQAVATCYNNCPNDPRASPAQQQVGVFCSNASLYGSAAQRKTASVSASATAAVASNSATPTAAATTGTNDAASTTASVSPTSTPNLGVGQLARNTGGVLLAVAGVVAAVL
ncbi:uncharacterized protein CTRU02_200311 [Colletotrichum truncatum]|uniref:Uncharacterized protein n=1 Tax=Colletotrichum truncatum TaxID=5467 RepID=A0ACC3ZE72_COLTU|nr:uncharacterized protein CTRU02_00065 [Colletotrichum truncatum]KAF6801316.1 hypothetical protein CTRU02_00065 [Colletotrichum truncatum]